MSLIFFRNYSEKHNRKRKVNQTSIAICFIHIIHKIITINDRQSDKQSSDETNSKQHSKLLVYE